jgi:CheY-like chemotaxis protein
MDESQMGGLIAENDTVFADKLAHNLQKLGYCIAITVSTTEATLKLINETRSALVLINIKLSGNVDAIQASEEIRHRSDIPIVFMTDDNEQRWKSALEGAGHGV